MATEITEQERLALLNMWSDAKSHFEQERDKERTATPAGGTYYYPQAPRFLPNGGDCPCCGRCPRCGRGGYFAEPPRFYMDGYVNTAGGIYE